MSKIHKHSFTLDRCRRSLRMEDTDEHQKMQTYYAHCSDVIMSTTTSQITDVSIVYSTVCSGADQRKHQNSASLAYGRGIHRFPAQRASNTENISIDGVIMSVLFSIFHNRRKLDWSIWSWPVWNTLSQWHTYGAITSLSPCNVMTPQLYFDKVLATNEDVSNALTSDIIQMRYIY